MTFYIDQTSAPGYLRSRGLLPPGVQPEVQVLGWGVSNILLKVTWGQGCLVVKQSLPKLRVEDDWFADRSRIYRETECMQLLGRLLERGRVPQVLYQDRENYLFVMTCAPAHGALWKEQLLRGEVDISIAARVGSLLGRIHQQTHDDPAVRDQFIDHEPFVQLRIDPYHWTTARRHPDVAQEVQAEAQRMLEVKTALVHGDYSPKNVIVADGDVMLLDFEVVHYGNPVFDLAFCLNHLFLKSVFNRHIRKSYFQAVSSFWRGYTQAATFADPQELEVATVRQLGCLMLARIDGKSPVEYIKDAPTKELVRGTAKVLIRGACRTLHEVAQLMDTRLQETGSQGPLS